MATSIINKQTIKLLERLILSIHKEVHSSQGGYNPDYCNGLISGIRQGINHLTQMTPGELMVKYNHWNMTFLSGFIEDSPFNRGFRKGFKTSYEMSK